LKRSTKLIFLNFSYKKLKIFCNFKVKYCRPLFVLGDPNTNDYLSTAYMDSYYVGGMIYDTYIWMLKILNIGAFIEWGYESKMGMRGSTLFAFQ
jgi:hypothetical protein